MEELKRRVVALLNRFVREKLARVSPLAYQRLYSLPDEAESPRDLKILALAVYYALAKDVRSVPYLERLFFNWQAHGVPQWALRCLAGAGELADWELLKEFGYNGEDDAPLDFRADEYYRFYRGAALGDKGGGGGSAG